MSKTFGGSYPIETCVGEIERLHIQGDLMADETRQMLKLIGVRPGWSCLDVGCGPRGITHLLSEAVGPSGRVLGLDMDEQFLAHGRTHAPANVEFRRGDAYDTGLPAGQFDLVHMRFVASTAGNPERLIREAVRLARPGGVVAMQEPDAETLHCYPPHPAYERLKAALLGAFTGTGAALSNSAHLFALQRQIGLDDVNFRPFLLGFCSTDAMADYLPSTVESVRGTVIRLGLLSDEEFQRLLQECRNHLRRPDTISTLYTVMQVWGRKPA